jgi:hypothetical protein
VQQCSTEVVAAAQRRAELSDTVTARLTMSSITMSRDRLAAAAANASLPETARAVRASARSLGAPRVVSELAPGASAAARAAAWPCAAARLAALSAVALAAAALPAAHLRRAAP